MPDVVVVGAGGFGRETLDVIEAWNASARGEPLRVAGVADDAPSELSLARLAARGVAHLGPVAEVLAMEPADHYLIGIGAGTAKEQIAAQFDGAGWSAASVVHPAASIGSVSRLGPGAIVCGGVQVSTNVELGRHVHLNPNATVGHDAVLADFVSVNPGAIVSGEVRIGVRTLIGAGAVVLQGLAIGADATVGASACVTRDVADGLVVMGVPAR